MEQAEALLREIAAHPDDDAPRIVYADWLLAHSTDPDDHARAQLIHAQCGLAGAHASEIPALQARAQELLKANKRMWVAELTAANIHAREWVFRRGFLERGTISAVRFVEVAPTLFRIAPMLRAMVFPEASNELVGLAESPYLARLDDVDLHEMCRCGRCKIENELPALFASPHARSLRRLVLSGCRIEHDNARLLFASPLLATLRELELRDNRITGPGLEPLAERATPLRRLVLAANPIGDGGARVLAGATQLAIEELDLSDCKLTMAGAAALASAPWADSITRLDLHGNAIDQGPERDAVRARFGDRVVM